MQILCFSPVSIELILSHLLLILIFKTTQQIILDYYKRCMCRKHFRFSLNQCKQLHNCQVFNIIQLSGLHLHGHIINSSSFHVLFHPYMGRMFSTLETPSLRLYYLFVAFLIPSQVTTRHTMHAIVMIPNDVD